MLSVFLQISDVADGSFWGKVADQAFSIVLLVVIAAALWQQQRKLEARLQQYMDDDRQKMLDVIERNTRVMERLEDKL